MDQITFVVPGEPQGQGRPRFSTRGGYARAYDTDRSRDYKVRIKTAAIDQMLRQGDIEPMTGPLLISIMATEGVGKSKTKAFRVAALCGNVRPTKKPDIDNIVKAVMDALNGTVYEDDRQVVSLQAWKVYGENPGLEITVKKV